MARAGALFVILCASAQLHAQEGGANWEEAPEPPPAPRAAPEPEPPPPPPPPPGPAPRIVVPPAPPPIASSGPLRRSVELIPELSITWAHCAAGDVSDDRCSGVKAGGEAGFTALWRVTPHIAWGGGLQLAVFGNHPPRSTGVTDAGAGAAFLGFLGRAYFLDRGAIDPYVQLGLGGGILGTGGTFQGEDYQATGAGPAVQLGGGVDFFVGQRLKLGPSISYTHVFIDKIRQCRGDGSHHCDDVSDDDGHLNSFLALGVRLSILLGPEL